MKKKETIENVVEQVQETFLDRLKKERSELFDKTDKLGQFIYSGKIKTIEVKQQQLLRQQLKAMSEYLAILDERISLL